MTTSRLHLQSDDLDLLLEDSTSEERNETILILQRYEETRRENQRWSDLDRQESEILSKWKREQEEG